MPLTLNVRPATRDRPGPAGVVDKNQQAATRSWRTGESAALTSKPGGLITTAGPKRDRVLAFIDSTRYATSTSAWAPA
jgi:hypothetical protein